MEMSYVTHLQHFYKRYLLHIQGTIKIKKQGLNNFISEKKQTYCSEGIL